VGKLTDIALCNALEGNGEELDNISVYCVQRRGHLLIALPADRDAARATLKLYQPQVFIGKAVAGVVGFLVRAGLHRILPCKSLAVRASGPLAVLVSDRARVGFLLGNPEADTRRALMVHKEAGGYVVDKVGVDQKSRASVMAELELIKTLPNKLTGIPVLHREHLGYGWASYATDFVEGTSPCKGDDEQVLGVLVDWMNGAETVPLSETEQWQKMTDYASRHENREIWEVLQKSATLRIKAVVTHGDFAPWNIKLSADGAVAVLDWETGCNEGPAGWDWLHYMIQRGSLVDTRSASETLKLCREWAKSEKGGRFLDEAGWGNQIEPWIGTYLAYSFWIAGFDRDELLSSWMVNQRLDS